MVSRRLNILFQEFHVVKTVERASKRWPCFEPWVVCQFVFLASEGVWSAERIIVVQTALHADFGLPCLRVSLYACSRLPNEQRYLTLVKLGILHMSSETPRTIGRNVG